MIPPPFRFKQFSIAHHRCAHKVGTDGVLLGAWAEAENPKSILDVGTGSGLIVLMLAQRFPKTQVSGIELDPASAEQAKENAAASPFADRVEIVKGDFLKYPFAEKFDLIVSNPPFFKGGYSSGKAERDRARHESALPQEKFLEKAVSILSPKGKLAVVLPKEEGKEFIAKAKARGLSLQKRTKVYGAPGNEDKRWLMQFGQTLQNLNETYLTLRNSDNSFSDPYRHMTREFHPDF